MRRTVNFLSAKKRLYPLSCKGYRRIVPSRAQVRACTRVRGHTRPRARVVVSKNSTAFRPEENSRASTAYSVFPVLPGGRRPRKVRLAPFPPVEIGQPSGSLLPYGCRIPLAGKTPPASLHPKGTSAPTPWAWALLLSPPCGARRDPLSVLPKEKRAVHGPKRKAPGCALVQWPSALKGGGESVPAPIWPCLRAR